MKIVTIIGARPQFIKAAVVSRVFATSKDVTEIIVHTGQHFDSNMSDIFFEEMCIPKPHYNLNIMNPIILFLISTFSRAVSSGKRRSS